MPAQTTPLRLGRPELRTRFGLPAGTAGWVVAAGAGVFAAVAAGPRYGLPLLALVAVALRARRYGAAVLAAGAVTSFGLAVAFVLARQAWKGGLRPDFEWPTYFHAAHVLAWLAIVLLAADVVFEIVARRAEDDAP